MARSIPRIRHGASRRAAGHGLLELTLVLGILLLMVVGTIDLGRLIYAHVSVQAAAETAALYASRSRDAAANLAAIETRARAELATISPKGVTPGRVLHGTADVTTALGADADGRQTVAVTVTGKVRPFFPFWPGMPATGEYTVARTAIMQIQVTI